MSRFPAALALAVGFLLGPAATAQEWNDRKPDAADFFESAFAGRSAPPPGAAATREEPRPDLDLVRRLIVLLFEAYERQSVAEFLALVAPGFAARDRSGTDYRLADLPRVLDDDFAIFVRTEHDVFVGQAVLQADGSRVEYPVRWSRRAWAAMGGQESIQRDQRSVLRFVRSPDLAWRLVAIFGDPLFGLADRRGRIVLDRGTFDGQAIGQPIVLDRYVGVVEQEEDAVPAAPAAPVVVVIRGVFAGRDIDVEFDNQSFVVGFGCTAPPGGIDFQLACGAAFPPGNINPANGAQILELPAGTNINSVAQAPPAGYAGVAIALSNPPNTDIGRAFAFITDIGHFGLFRIVAVDGANNYTFEFIYQPDGSRQFQ